MSFTFALAAVLSVAVPGEAPDTCAALIPKTLRSAVARVHPDSGLVRESEYDPAMIASELQYRHRNRCLGAASADVNGDGRNDYAFIIVAKDGNALVIAPLAAPDGRWQLSTLETFGEDSTPRGYFVNTYSC